jgi:hypothetical protein
MRQIDLEKRNKGYAYSYTRVLGSQNGPSTCGDAQCVDTDWSDVGHCEKLSSR